MIDEVDDAGGPHIDRRGLLKRAGAAGALGLAAPITFDSFFSPAAACSLDEMLAEQRGILESATDAASYNIPVAATTAGSMLVIAFTIAWNDTPSDTPLTTASVTGSGQITDPTTQVMSRFHDTSNFDIQVGDYYLGVIVGTATGTAGTVTVTFPSAFVYTFTALAIEVFQSVTPAALTVGDIGPLSTGNSSSASAALGGLASPNAAQLVFFGSESATIYTPDTDEFIEVGQARQTDQILFFFDSSVSTHVMFGNVAQAGAVTSSLDATTNWGAIAMEVLC